MRGFLPVHLDVTCPPQLAERVEIRTHPRFLPDAPQSATVRTGAFRSAPIWAGATDLVVPAVRHRMAGMQRLYPPLDRGQRSAQVRLQLLQLLQRIGLSLLHDLVSPLLGIAQRLLRL